MAQVSFGVPHFPDVDPRPSIRISHSTDSAVRYFAGLAESLVFSTQILPVEAGSWEVLGMMTPLAVFG